MRVCVFGHAGCKSVMFICLLERSLLAPAVMRAAPPRCDRAELIRRAGTSGDERSVAKCPAHTPPPPPHPPTLSNKAHKLFFTSQKSCFLFIKRVHCLIVCLLKVEMITAPFQLNQQLLLDLLAQFCKWSGDGGGGGV